MATRYNVLGWYNPFAPKALNLGGMMGGCAATGATAGQQPLSGLIVPIVAGPSWQVEPGIRDGFVQVINEEKVTAAPAAAATTTTTTTTTTNGSAGGSSGTTADSNKQLSSTEKSEVRKLGVALSIMACFTLGVAVSFLIVKTAVPCGTTNASLDTATNDLIVWGIRAIDFPLPIFSIVTGILCVVVRERAGGQAKAIVGLSIFTLVLPTPMHMLSGSVGVFLAYQCTSGIDIVELVLPCLNLLMALVLTGLLLYIVILTNKLSKATPAPMTHTPTTTTVTTTSPTQPTQPTQTVPTTATTAFPAPIQPVISAQTQPLPTFPVQPMLQLPAQQYAFPGFPQPAYGRPPPNYQRPSYNPYNPYQAAPRYPSGGIPMFGGAPYRRPPYGGSPYGYSPYRAPQAYRPNPYMF